MKLTKHKKLPPPKNVSKYTTINKQTTNKQQHNQQHNQHIIITVKHCIVYKVVL